MDAEIAKGSGERQGVLHKKTMRIKIKLKAYYRATGSDSESAPEFEAAIFGNSTGWHEALTFQRLTLFRGKINISVIVLSRWQYRSLSAPFHRLSKDLACLSADGSRPMTTRWRSTGYRKRVAGFCSRPSRKRTRSGMKSSIRGFSPLSWQQGRR